jgi:hypothetical protein
MGWVGSPKPPEPDFRPAPGRDPPCSGGVIGCFLISERVSRLAPPRSHGVRVFAGIIRPCLCHPARSPRPEPSQTIRPARQMCVEKRLTHWSTMTQPAPTVRHGVGGQIFLRSGTSRSRVERFGHQRQLLPPVQACAMRSIGQTGPLERVAERASSKGRFALFANRWVANSRAYPPRRTWA